LEDLVLLDEVESNKKYLPEIATFEISLSNTFTLSEICFVTYGLRLNSDKEDKNFKFKKENLLSKTRTVINNRLYTEGKNLERYFIKKVLYVEWGTERCPARLVRPTFPELYTPNKLLLSRQKRLATFADDEIICDNTVIMAILADDLSEINNRNVAKYYQNIGINRGNYSGSLNSVQ
jgi:hypothetical protein